MSRYIHLNPVRAGVVTQPEGYMWSSFRGYYRARSTLDWVNYRRVLSEFGSERSQARRAYRRFMEEGMEGRGESPLREALHGFILGREGFVVKIECLVKRRDDDGSMPELRTLRSGPAIEAIVAETAGSYELRRGEVVRRGRGRPEARDVALYLARELTGGRLKEIGELFGGLSKPLVSSLTSTIRERLNNDRSFFCRVTRIREKIISGNRKL